MYEEQTSCKLLSQKCYEHVTFQIFKWSVIQDMQGVMVGSFDFNFSDNNFCLFKLKVVGT
jgi:hypothetical protein